ncbi:MAG: 2-oxo-4-hydroxy-4-carboxy-5-ureidoimidazoline decarboxylase [Pirellulales bacterium]|nr:2-oxo-4-hydroxy-4-carboxy-5-ureidoimidazoline decarboxylase [Pirellulales bacterium]
MSPESVAALNAADPAAVAEEFRKCCGAEAWIRAMTARRPFAGAATIHAAADECFDQLADADWLEAFACHPKIGDVSSLRMKFAGNDRWSRGEQAGVDAASEDVIQALAAGNETYLARFGYIFIVCATGKDAAEMLAILAGRLRNDPQEELPIAAAEQRKITHLRLDKLGFSPR